LCVIGDRDDPQDSLPPQWPSTGALCTPNEHNGHPDPEKGREDTIQVAYIPQRIFFSLSKRENRKSSECDTHER
jgi:hypothetical protein